ncbi:unnamed protein product [Ectocarpus sp. 12 AP-2014]
MEGAAIGPAEPLPAGGAYRSMLWTDENVIPGSAPPEGGRLGRDSAVMSTGLRMWPFARATAKCGSLVAVANIGGGRGSTNSAGECTQAIGACRGAAKEGCL